VHAGKEVLIELQPRMRLATPATTEQRRKNHWPVGAATPGLRPCPRPWLWAQRTAAACWSGAPLTAPRERDMVRDGIAQHLPSPQGGVPQRMEATNRVQRSRLALVTLGHFLNDSYGSFFGKFHSPRKVDNSFPGRATAYRHCPLCSRLAPRLWLTQLSYGVRPFPTATRAKSCPALFR
jgi:hypothetical protein